MIHPPRTPTHHGGLMDRMAEIGWAAQMCTGIETVETEDDDQDERHIGACVR